MPLDLKREKGRVRNHGCAACGGASAIRVNVIASRTGDNVSVGSFSTTWCEEHGVLLFEAIERTVQEAKVHG